MYEHESENLICEPVLYSEKQESGNFQSQVPTGFLVKNFLTKSHKRQFSLVKTGWEYS